MKETYNNITKILVQMKSLILLLRNHYDSKHTI